MLIEQLPVSASEVAKVVHPVFRWRLGDESPGLMAAGTLPLSVSAQSVAVSEDEVARLGAAARTGHGDREPLWEIGHQQPIGGIVDLGDRVGQHNHRAVAVAA